ncbi:hypothetical protein BCAMP_11510 [Brochothrix campestris FSL F6-1037]|uniref:Uncharacterized protein n=1 Tax=Brochothrix campestris FSL F6-1037 TaxID=1265861 RepID=W7C850_9LIST|nr:hypothetical protein BCAMP_11510 [Brochothrix campestris FSL F6-1037]
MNFRFGVDRIVLIELKITFKKEERVGLSSKKAYRIYAYRCVLGTRENRLEQGCIKHVWAMIGKKKRKPRQRGNLRHG